MPTTIKTTTGTGSPTKFPNQRRLAVTSNGVLWAAILPVADNRIEFWRSTDGGANWTEVTGQRISGVKQEAGCSIRIAARGGEERIVVIYVHESSQRVRINFGKFRDNRQTFTWQAAAVNVSIANGGNSAFWKNPDCELVPKGTRWLVPCVWSRLYQGRCRLHYQRWLLEDTGSGHGQAGGDYELHVRTSSIHTHPTVSVEHAGGVILSNPSIYIAWGQGNGTSEEGGSPPDPQPRQYLMRMPPSGNNWARGTARVMREAGVGRDPGAGSVTDAVFTGEAFVSARAPSGPQEAKLQLHVMLPKDNVREVIEVPELNKGAVINVATTYDPFNGDVFIVANGATDMNLALIRYQWPLRQWTSWADVTTEGAVSDSLSLKPNTSSKRIEGVYAIVSGGNRAVRHHVFGAVNTIPLQPSWLAAHGARNRNTGLTIGPWQHNDPDGDAQAAYTLERRVNGGDPTYWNGVGWQAGLVNISSAAASVALASGWAAVGDVVEFRVRTSDGSGFSPWSEALIIVASALINPTILSPTAGANITSVPLLVEWDVAEQSAYLVELKTGDGSGLLWSSGWVGAAGIRVLELPYELENGVAYDVEVTTQNDAGLTSTTAKHDITVSLTPPPLPSFTWVAVPAEGAIDVMIDNGGPGVGEAAAETNDVLQVNAAGVETLVATGLGEHATFRDRYLAADVEVDYVIVAKTADGATRRSS